MSNHHHDQLPYRQDHDRPWRPSRRKDHALQNTGYGGGVSVRSGLRSPSFREQPRRSSHPRDQYSCQWQNQDPFLSLPAPPRPPSPCHSGPPYHNQHPHQAHNPTHSSPRPRSSNSNNPFTGGCPFIHAPRSDRNCAQPDPQITSKNSPPLPNKSPDNSPHYHRDNTHLASPYKPVSTSLSSVNPSSACPRVKPATAPFIPTISAAPSSSLGIPLSSHGSSPPVHTSNQPPHFDRRSTLPLKCEKDLRRGDRLLPSRAYLPDSPASLEYAPIARPTPVPVLQNPPEISAPNEQAHSNGSLSKSNVESEQTEITNPSREHERASSTQRESPKTIFKKLSRVPEVPDENLSSHYYPAPTEKVYRNGLQRQKEPEGSERPFPKTKPPLLRSVPVPRSKLEDTPQGEAGAAAMQRAFRGDHSGVNMQRDCNGHNETPRSPEPPYDLEERRTMSPEHSVRVIRRNIESSMADMKLVDRKENYSASEREQSQRLRNHQESQGVSLSDYGQARLLRGGNRRAQVPKRRTDFDGSREPRTKRSRPSMPPETVNVDDTTGSRRSRRFQSPQRKENKWETIKFEKERVHKLFLRQLRNQPMLLRISFLGLSDGDLRTTLDICKSERRLPRPNHRRLEINNNRIRHITDEMCGRISTLSVELLNLSCNLLTTIGGKIGLCSQLRFLNLSRNQLSSLPQELCDLTELEVLNMSRNGISRLPSGLCRLKRLEVLSLAWNNIEVLPEDIAAEGAVLSDLDLSHNEKFHFFPRCAEHWTKLEVLHIPETAIYGLLSRREHRLRPAALVKELAGRKEHMFNQRTGLRSQSL